MSNPYFQFKQFTVRHDKCAMKVGTDGVLLGSWTDVSAARNILDVGAGTGLVSLMIAQRCAASITALEIDADATCQALENVNHSPWRDRIEVVQADYKEFLPEYKFDLIVSNPPYFSESLKCPDKQRTTARHTDVLTYPDLIAKTASILHQNGKFSLIIPSDTLAIVKEVACTNGLYPCRQTNVHTKPDVPSKRTLVTFSFKEVVPRIDDLVIELSRHVYSKEYIELTKEYYLKM